MQHSLDQNVKTLDGQQKKPQEAILLNGDHTKFLTEMKQKLLEIYFCWKLIGTSSLSDDYSILSDLLENTNENNASKYWKVLV